MRIALRRPLGSPLGGRSHPEALRARALGASMRVSENRAKAKLVLQLFAKRESFLKSYRMSR